MIQQLPIGFAFVLLGSVAGWVAAFGGQVIECPPRGMCLDGVVVRVIDGDTIVVRSQIEYQVRLLDCWAPESRTRDAEEKTRGLKSKARMAELATDKSCRVFLPSTGRVEDMVTMGRVLGRVWITDNGKPATVDLSTVMVGEGLAKKTKAEE
tara:strand:- start:545 stop:1000 length:456 start_codon:yes stop_codon:yes gene_type:complete